MTWLTLSVSIIVILIWLGRRPNYYRNVKPEEFTRFFETFIKQGSNRNLMFIKHMDSQKFIQFAKYFTASSKTTINFGFPDASWSRSYFRSLMNKFDNSCIKYNIESVKDEDSLVTRFFIVNMTVNNPTEIAKRCVLISIISFRVMGVKNDEKFRVHFEGRLHPDATSSRPALERLLHLRRKWLRDFAREYLEILDRKRLEEPSEPANNLPKNGEEDRIRKE